MEYLNLLHTTHNTTHAQRNNLTMNFLNTKQRSRQVWSLHATTRMRAIYLRKSFEKAPSFNIFAWNRSMPSLDRFFKPREAQASKVVYLFQQSNTKRLLNTTAVCVCSWFLLLNVTVKFVNVIFKKPKDVSNIFFFTSVSINVNANRQTIRNSVTDGKFSLRCTISVITTLQTTEEPITRITRWWMAQA